MDFLVGDFVSLTWKDTMGIVIEVAEIGNHYRYKVLWLDDSSDKPSMAWYVAIQIIGINPKDGSIFYRGMINRNDGSISR